MPELPEVEVVRRGLAAAIVGRSVTDVTVLHPRPVRAHPDGPTGFVTSLTGRTFEVPARRGKFLWMPFSDGDALLAHLGMSGQFRLDAPAAPLQRHARVLIDLDDDVQLRFVDQRMFGGLSLAPGGAELPVQVTHIARDLLDPEVDLAGVVRRIKAKRSAIKRVLLDQRVVSGIGNIYADEALWVARVHPETPADRLSTHTLGALLRAARDVMEAALAQGGTSFDALYVNVNGESGYFNRDLHVYGREGEACERCGTPIRRVAFTNRSSHFCPGCQRRR